MTTVVPTLVFTLAATAAAVSDVRMRRVSNRLNLAILVLGLGWRATAGGAEAPLWGLAGAGVGLCMLLAPFALRWLGAGDVKLMAALGAWLGPADAVSACLLGLVGGGALSLAMALTGGAALRRDVAGNLGRALGSMSAPAAPRRAQRYVVPMAVPFAAAAVLVWFLGGGL